MSSIKSDETRLNLVGFSKLNSQCGHFITSCLSLLKHHFQTFATNNGLLEELEKHNSTIDLIIMELDINSKKDINAFTNIQETYISLPIVVITSPEDIEENRAKIISLGAQECLAWNNISPRKLQTVIKSCIERHKKITQQVKLKEVIQKQMDSKMEFLAKFSHEIRTPLNTIIGGLSIISQQNQQIPLADVIDNMKVGCNSLLRSVDDVLDLAKINAKQFNLVKEEHNSDSLFRELISMFQGQAQNKGLYLTSLVDDQLPQEITTDSHRIKQILANFLSNAIKFTKKGYVNLNIHFERATGELYAEVNDSGRGLSEDSLKNLFISFAQGKETDTFNGTGLGLSICKMLADLFGGSVGAYNKSVGAVFWLKVPISDFSEQNAIASQKNPSILIVSSTTREESRLFKQLNPIFEKVAFLKSGGVFSQDLKCDILLLDDFSWEIPESERMVRTIPTSFFERIFSYHANKFIFKRENVYQTLGCHFSLIEQIRNTEQKKNALQIDDDSQVDLNLSQGIVLICDDDTGNRNILSRILSLRDIETVQASNGIEAIEMVRNVPNIDLIIMDCQMPEMDGFEASKRIKEMKPDLPIIALTGKEINQALLLDKQAAMDEFIQKPIKNNSVDQILRKYFVAG